MSRNGCVALPHGAMGCLQFVIVAFPNHTHLLFITLRPRLSKVGKSRPWGYKTQTQNKLQWLAACWHVSASSQSLRFILSLRMNASFITLRQGLQKSEPTSWKVRPQLILVNAQFIWVILVWILARQLIFFHYTSLTDLKFRLVLFWPYSPTWQVTASVWQIWVFPVLNSPNISVIDPVSIPPVM